MIIGIIPARGGSKGIPRKNIKEIAGKPLIAWSIEAAKNSQKLDAFYVSTEDPEIAVVAREYGAKVIDRPRELATDEADMMAVLNHALDQTKAKTIVLLQPTSPVRDPDLIDRCISIYQKENADSLATGYNCKIFEYGTYSANRQELKGFFHDDGNVVILTADLIRKNKRIGERPVKLEISREQSFEIDDELDFLINEQILLKKKNGRMLKVGNKTIGQNQPCFIIAEAGVNQMADLEDLQQLGLHSPLEAAYRMVDLAKEAGADAIKFQLFTAKNLQYPGTKKPTYQVQNVGDDQQISYYNMLQSLETSKEDLLKISNYCKQKGIIFLCTSYDEESADYLDQVLHVEAFKLASIELNNHFFTKYVARKGKPLLISCGLSDFKDVQEALELAQEEQYFQRLVLLQCTSNYPAPLEEINLRVLENFKRQFPGLLLGFSDHAQTDIPSLGAVALGAVVLEKHFTLNKRWKGPDHSSSLNPEELKLWISHVREIEKALGNNSKKITESEKGNLSMRKYFVIKPCKKGTIVAEPLLKTLRTGQGILPTQENLKLILGRMINCDIPQETPLDWSLLEENIPAAKNREDN